MSYVKSALAMVEDIQSVPKHIYHFSDCFTAIGLCTQHQKLISTTLHATLNVQRPK